MGASSSAEAKDLDEEMVLNDLHIETGDQTAVKNLLDDTIVEFFKENEDYTLHYGWDNAKLSLMLLAVVLAAMSHFFKHPAIPEHIITYSCVAGDRQVRPFSCGQRFRTPNRTIPSAFTMPKRPASRKRRSCTLGVTSTRTATLTKRASRRTLRPFRHVLRRRTRSSKQASSWVHCNSKATD
uniref:Signal peptidase complex subunit 2 n=1 Tax=Hyaloperonospora arabidopsidis (strain Emoy2) TaxID=559515 RepID=M4C3C2_HYAAE